RRAPRDRPVLGGAGQPPHARRDPRAAALAGPDGRQRRRSLTPPLVAHRLEPSGAVAGLLDRCWFPPAGSEVTCAVSGGPDSLALLVLAVHAGCSVTAVHVDHGLRAGSDAEADVVAAAAHRFGARFRAERVAVGAGPNLEARARAARYRMLPSDVLTGHTADDQAETVLLN